MSKDEFLKSLDLPFQGDDRGNEYIITIDNSNDFSLLYNLISNNENLSMDDDSVTTSDNALFTFFNDYFEIKLIANFDKDIYRAIVGSR